MKYILLLTALLHLTLVNAQVPFIKERKPIALTDWKFSKGVIYNAQTVGFNDASWEKVKVPHTFSMDAINDVGYYRGVAWYRHKIRLPYSMKEERIFIRFEGVGQEAVVHVNGKKVGQHIGGYSAFCYEITDVVEVGKENSIVVKASNAPNFQRIPVDDALFNHYGGIYRPVHIFSTPPQNIKPTFFASSGVFVEVKDLKKDVASLEIRTHLSSKTNADHSILDLKVLDKEKKVITEKNRTINLLSGDSIVISNTEIPYPIRWDGRKNPYLYTVEVSLNSGQKTDKVAQTFGIKSFKVDAEKGAILNEKPYRIYGVAMHQEWKDRGPALLPENHKKDMEMVNEIGATGLRLSHYQHSDITYQLADEMGLMVWAEIPFVHNYSGRERQNAIQQLKELIYQNYNHPSIYAWGLWNEVRAWKSKDEPCVILTEELNQITHQIDKTRLTVSASDRGMESNMGNISDLQAWNKYYGWYYGEYADMAKWLDDARKEYPSIALGISEYGVGGNIYQQDISRLEKPIGNYFPEQIQTQYHETTWKIIKDRPFVWSSFVWNMFDFSVAGWNRGGIKNLNHKGLVTFDRKVKKDAFYFYKANWSDSPVLHIAEARNDQRTEANTSVKVFTNLDKVTLKVNGKTIQKKKLTNDMHTVLFENITLKKGKNSIEVLGNNGKEIYSHKAEWFLVDQKGNMK
ncbi:glycoside hydrolase family 2 protein [Flammeovirga aprica]|uniref:Glycoside hydrolase family 2 protein n=1 Tax=Flammeovirga aprica JL-4 TaxID=694437 RepID=A0A7X9RYN7_9BACT|nr:glycoside hydrolase family 2 TIM barrel-domain containing protein [Flammeovirga aprica]NME71062.1 glycoside hydrolase family 2 protein [Flammeovirga aprica JL-4]